MQENTLGSANNNRILTGSISGNFFSLVIPSLVGLVAFSSASIVDGIFIGNYVGTPALAAINLIIPYLNVMFGIAFMLSIGGSVVAGKYIGENNLADASNIFSKILMITVLFSITVTVLSLTFESYIFKALGATEALTGLMSDYFQIRMSFMLIDLITIALYYFVRTDGRSTLAAIAIVISSSINIILDYYFIAEFKWGLQGAALATGLAQCVSFVILLTYFFTKHTKFIFRIKQKNWSEVLSGCYNGLSEFINEVSANFIAFTLNWLLIIQHGVNGVAAITVINYLLIMGVMLVYSVSEGGQVFISQNYGAKNFKRIQRYFALSMLACLLLSALCIWLLLGYTQFMINLFLDDDSEQAAQLAHDYVAILWPIFLFNSFTIMISAYFTGLHKPKESAIIALLRSLILPTIFLIIFYYWVEGISFLWALPLAEAVTFITAIILFIINRPSKIERPKTVT
ncbi:MAG: putative MATE family efflux protein [Bermanella sp.]